MSIQDEMKITTDRRGRRHVGTPRGSKPGVNGNAARWSPEGRASSAVRALFDPAISAAAVEYVRDWPPLTAAQCAAVRAVGLAIVRRTDADGRADG